MGEPIFFVNGDFVPAGDAALPLNDLGIVRGYGIFDLWRTYNRAHFHMTDHLTRLRSSAAQLALDVPWSDSELTALIQATHDRNNFDNAVIRVIVTGGPAPDFMTPQGTPSLVIMVTPAPAYVPELYNNGVKVTTTEMIRERPTVKSLNYIGAIMAVEEAKKAGAVEAIYRTADGYLTEGTRANLFIFKGQQLITPEVDVLPGITRKVVMDLAAEEFQVVERPLHLSEVATADEAFITSSTKEVLPVVQVDELVIGAGAPGVNSRRLLQIFRDHAWSLAIAEAMA